MKLVGIDPGVATGFAVWDAFEKKLLEVKALPIHRAFEEVDNMHKYGEGCVVFFEDARQRTWFGSADARQAKYGAAIREGVGSVKRDCCIWQDFLTDREIPFVARKPLVRGTKWPSLQFARATGWQKKTNEHGRDAAMLVYGLPHNVAVSLWAAHVKGLEVGERAHTATGT